MNLHESQQQRYTAPLRTRIELFIVDLEASQQVLRKQDDDIGISLDTLVDIEQGIIDRLRAILSDSDASDAEKGSESSVGEG